MIYLDHNATTPLAPEVRIAMEPYLNDRWGNPASSYSFGSELRQVIERSRIQVAALINASPDEVVFTSGGTEANNTALFSAIHANPDKRHIITTAVEHSSVLAYCYWLESIGYRLTVVGVDRDGRINYEELEDSIDSDTALVSVMWANNETGVIFPVERIAVKCYELGVAFHTDAVQAAGKIAIDVKQQPYTYLALAGHKINGPKSIGALFVRRGSTFKPLIRGGHQERSRRGGTQDVASIVGLGVAATIASAGVVNYEEAVGLLRTTLETQLTALCYPAFVNGGAGPRIANTTNISFPGIGVDGLLLMLDKMGVCASSGSACLADSSDVSHVITAMFGKSRARRDNLRLSIGRLTTAEQINTAVECISECVKTLRLLNSQF